MIKPASSSGSTFDMAIERALYAAIVVVAVAALGCLVCDMASASSGITNGFKAAAITGGCIAGLMGIIMLIRGIGKCCKSEETITSADFQSTSPVAQKPTLKRQDAQLDLLFDSNNTIDIQGPADKCKPHQ